MSATPRNHDGTVPTYLAGVGSFKGVLTPSDSAVYDPPLLMIACTAPGNVVLVYDQDNEANGASYDTLTLTLGQEISNRLIRQVRATGTTATVKGYAAQ